MKKETIKNHNIVDDINYINSVHLNRFHYCAIAAILFPIILPLLICIAIEQSVGAIIFLILALLVFSPFVIEYFVAAKRKSNITKHGFTVTKSKLLSATQKQLPYSVVAQKFNRSTYNLSFSAGQWIVCKNPVSYYRNTGERHLYRWSNELSMSFDGLLNTSVSGDEFYVVIDNVTQEILYAYNSKFFNFLEQ